MVESKGRRARTNEVVLKRNGERKAREEKTEKRERKLTKEK